MNCSEAHELTGTVLDGQLDATLRTAFFGHIEACKPCRRSYELEGIAKDVVHRRVGVVPVPSDVRRSVLTAIAVERTGEEPQSENLWARLFGLVPSPAFAVAAVFAIAAFLMVPGEPSTEMLIRHTAENDILHQASENFLMIRDGKITPSITTSSPEQASAYLTAQHVPFTPVVRPFSTCASYGAIANEYRGVPLAHVVYKIGDEMLYVYEVGAKDAVEHRGGLTIPVAAREALESSGWYVDPQHPDCSLVLWEENGTLCAAASSMPKEKMLALLASR